MAAFDYGTEAELFPARSRTSKYPKLRYRRFAQAADAIRFVIEEVPPGLLLGVCLEIDEERYNSEDIRRLYESNDYPLARRTAGEFQ